MSRFRCIHELSSSLIQSTPTGLIMWRVLCKQLKSLQRRVWFHRRMIGRELNRKTGRKVVLQSCNDECRWRCVAFCVQPHDYTLGTMRSFRTSCSAESALVTNKLNSSFPICLIRRSERGGYPAPEHCRIVIKRARNRTAEQKAALEEQQIIIFPSKFQ